MPVPAVQDVLVGVTQVAAQVVHWAHRLDEAFGHMHGIHSLVRGVHDPDVFQDLDFGLLCATMISFWVVPFRKNVTVQCSFCCRFPLLPLLLNVACWCTSAGSSFCSGTLRTARLFADLSLDSN